MGQTPNDVQKTVVGALNQAREATVGVSSIVHDVSTWIGPHIVLVVALSCVLLLAATYGAGCHILSSTLGDIERSKICLYK